MLMEKNEIVKGKWRPAVLACQFLESVWLACPWRPVTGLPVPRAEPTARPLPPSPLAPAQGQELPSDPAVSDEPWGVRQDVSGKNMQLGD